MAGDTIHRGDTRRKNRWSLAIWGGAAALLSIPAIAMQFEGSGFDWDVGDFVAMGALLAIACGGYEIATRMSSNWAYRAGAAVAILTCFLTVWVNLAVGMGFPTLVSAVDSWEVARHFSDRRKFRIDYTDIDPVAVTDLK